MRAALEGETETVERLFETRTDVNETDDEGRTALMFAVTNIHRDTAKRLLEHGADVNAVANDGSTALILAASAGDAKIVRDLLSEGADPSARFTQTGKTALMVAKEKNFTEIVRLLEGAGARQ
jgi:hypothetical protein